MYDLIVVGGGPAGSAAGQRAAALGLNVLLLEKATFPRYKPCGGALSAQALSYIGGIPDNLVENEIYGLRVRYKNQTVEVCKDKKVATLTSRVLFDNYLLGKARASGTEVRFEKVVNFSEEEGYVRVTTNQEIYSTRFLIIAEGAHGNLKHAIRSRDNKDQYGVCMVAQVQTSDEQQCKVPAGMLEVEFGIASLGYGWIFPHNTYCSVGIGGIAHNMKNVKKRFNDYVAHHGLSPDSVPRGHCIPAGGITRKLSGKRTLLCGDAGGFVDAFFGEGIAYAIRSGQLAAEELTEIIKGNNRASLPAYEKKCRDEFNDNLKYSLILSRAMHRFPGIFFPIFISDSKFLDKCLDIPLMRTTYKKFLFFMARQMIRHVPLHILKSVNSIHFSSKPPGRPIS
jgi:geranylgeranyl reductase family protein